MATREQIMQALLLLLAGTGNFVTVGRRNNDPEGLGPSQTPALFLFEHSEEFHRPSANLPPVIKLKVLAIFYADTGPDVNAIPSAPVNNALDALQTALLPDNRETGFFTLGGLVYGLYVEGEIMKAPGDKTGKSLAIVPITIIPNNF
jgi:hypothetical protein